MMVVTVQIKAIQNIASNPLFKGCDITILMVGSRTEKEKSQLADATSIMEQTGFNVISKIADGQADIVISEAVKSKNIDLLVMGAYGHSRLRTLIIGSTTSEMIRSCLIPVMLFR